MHRNLLSNLILKIMKSLQKNTCLNTVKSIFFSLLILCFFSLFVSCSLDESDELIYNSILEEQEILASDEENQPDKNNTSSPPKKD